MKERTRAEWRAIEEQYLAERRHGGRGKKALSATRARVEFEWNNLGAAPVFESLIPIWQSALSRFGAAAQKYDNAETTWRHVSPSMKWANMNAGLRRSLEMLHVKLTIS